MITFTLIKKGLDNNVCLFSSDKKYRLVFRFNPLFIYFQTSSNVAKCDFFKNFWQRLWSEGLAKLNDIWEKKSFWESNDTEELIDKTLKGKILLKTIKRENFVYQKGNQTMIAG